MEKHKQYVDFSNANADNITSASTTKKQETLKEVAERLYPINIVVDYDTNEDIRNIWIEGAKWQQEIILEFLYSEITERRDYSASKMCEVIIEFIKKSKTN